VLEVIVEESLGGRWRLAVRVCRCLGGTVSAALAALVDRALIAMWFREAQRRGTVRLCSEQALLFVSSTGGAWEKQVPRRSAALHSSEW